MMMSEKATRWRQQRKGRGENPLSHIIMTGEIHAPVVFRGSRNVLISPLQNCSSQPPPSASLHTSLFPLKCTAHHSSHTALHQSLTPHDTQ